MKEKPLDSIRLRFLTYNFHDAAIVGMSIFDLPESDMSNVRMLLHLPFGIHPNLIERQAELTFLDCRYFKAGLDLLAKRHCGDAIYSVTCELDSTLKRDLEAGFMRHEKEPLKEYLHFGFELSFPESIDIFAKDFSLVVSDG